MQIVQAALVAATAVVALLLSPLPAEAGENSLAMTIAIDGAIGPAAASYVKDALAKAAERRAGVVVLRLNTPGGLTTSMVAMTTDVIRAGRPVVGYGFSSIGRFAQGGLIRDRFAPRLLSAGDADLANDDGTSLDPFRAWAIMMKGEKPGGHGERCVAIGTLDMALWDAAARSRRSRSIVCWQSSSAMEQAKRAAYPSMPVAVTIIRPMMRCDWRRKYAACWISAKCGWNCARWSDVKSISRHRWTFPAISETRSLPRQGRFMPRKNGATPMDEWTESGRDRVAFRLGGSAM